MKGERIFVTGGSGFIGRYLMSELERRGATVMGTTMGAEAPNLINLALADKPRMTEALREFQPGTVVHLAAIASVIHADIQQMYNVNVLGTENLIEAVLAANIRPTMILASTAGVYGNQEKEFLTEDLPYNPSNHYSYTKMIVEMLARQYSGDFPIHVLRLFNIAGVGQSSFFLIPKIVRHFKDHEPLLKLGNIDAVREYVDVQYCARVIADLITRKHAAPFTVNICSGQGYTGHDVLDLLTEICGYRPKIEISDQFVRKNEVWRLVGDTKNLYQLLGGASDFPNLRDILTAMYHSTT